MPLESPHLHPQPAADCRNRTNPVKDQPATVKKASTTANRTSTGPSFEVCLPVHRHIRRHVDRREVGVVVYIVLTLAIFAVLGLVQKLVEDL
jgi:hypothetical protein